MKTTMRGTLFVKIVNISQAHPAFNNGKAVELQVAFRLAGIGNEPLEFPSKWFAAGQDLEIQNVQVGVEINVV